MKDKRLQQYLQRMFDMIEKIETYTKDIHTIESFQQQEEKIDACITPLVQIGELAGQLKKHYPEISHDIPYKEIVGFRNILVHMYHSIDIKAVRVVIKHRLPELKQIINTYRLNQTK